VLKCVAEGERFAAAGKRQGTGKEEET